MYDHVTVSRKVNAHQRYQASSYAARDAALVGDRLLAPTRGYRPATLQRQWKRKGVAVAAASVGLAMALAGCIGGDVYAIVEESSEDFDFHVDAKEDLSEIRCKITDEGVKLGTMKDTDKDCLPDHDEVKRGLDVNDADSDDDGLDDNWELMGPLRDITDPLTATLLVEMDYYQGGENPVPPLSKVAQKKLKDLYAEQYVDLFIDLGGGSGEKGGQVIKGSQGPIGFDVAENAVNNPDYFSPERHGKFHYVVMADQPLEYLHDGEKAGAIGLGRVNSDLVLLTPQATWQAEVHLFNHEEGHNFGFNHVQDLNNVMGCGSSQVTFQGEQWKFIREEGLQNSLKNTSTVVSHTHDVCN